MDFSDEFKKRQKEIEEIIISYLPKEEGYQKIIFQAMNYSILAGGKRLRPMLMRECFRLFDGKNSNILNPFLAAIEMIHTYSLVHDDLPAMDDDDYRRGRKTTHIVFGEAIGILAGDALLNYAFETALQSFFHSDDKGVAKALKILAKKAGVFGMIGGQVVDVESNDQILTKDKLDFIYKLKTGALIEASMVIGAILAGADEEELLIIEDIALDIGMAFQIQDDILDVISTTEILGKPVHSDEKNNKTTYVSILGIEEAKKEVEKYLNHAMDLLKDMKKSNEFLERLIITLINREK